MEKLRVGDVAALDAIEGLKLLVVESCEESCKHVDTKIDALRDWLQEHVLQEQVVQAPTRCCCSNTLTHNANNEEKEEKEEKEAKDREQDDGADYKPTPGVSNRKCTGCGNKLMPDAMFCTPRTHICLPAVHARMTHACMCACARMRSRLHALNRPHLRDRE